MSRYGQGMRRLGGSCNSLLALKLKLIQSNFIPLDILILNHVECQATYSLYISATAIPLRNLLLIARMGTRVLYQEACLRCAVHLTSRDTQEQRTHNKDVRKTHQNERGYDCTPFKSYLLYKFDPNAQILYTSCIANVPLCSVVTLLSF